MKINFEAMQAFKKLEQVFAIFCIYILLSCNDNEQKETKQKATKADEICAASSKEAFELLQSNLKEKDILSIKQLCVQP